MALVPAYRGVKVTSQTVARLAKSGELPANVQDGDYVLCAVAFNGGPGTVTTPTGWTAVTSLITVASNPQLQVFGRVWREGDPMTVVVTSTTAVAASIVCACFSGVDPVTPMDATPVTGGSATVNTSHTNTGITTVTANALVVGINAANSSTATFTTASLTERWDTGAQKAQTGGTLTVASPGATGTITWTCSGSLAFANAVVALRPDPQRAVPDFMVTVDQYAYVRRRGRQVTPGFRGPGDTTGAVTGSHPRFGNYTPMVIAEGLIAAGGTMFPVTLTATATGSAAVILQPRLTRAATATGSPSITRFTGKTLAVTASAATSVTRMTGKLVTATATGTAALTTARAFLRTLTATASGAATVTVQAAYRRTLTATSTAAATIIRQARKTLTTSSTVSPAIQLMAGKTLTATATGTPSLTAIKVILRTLVATASGTASMILNPRKLVTATATATASIVKRVGKTVTATAAGTAVLSVTKVFLRTLTATATGTATITRRVSKSVAAAATGAAAIVRRPLKTIAVASTATPTITRTTQKTLTATATVTAIIEWIVSTGGPFVHRAFDPANPSAVVLRNNATGTTTGAPRYLPFDPPEPRLG